MLSEHSVARDNLDFMDLKFTFAGASSDHGHDGAPAGIPLPLAGAPSPGETSGQGSSILELVVTQTDDGSELVCEGRSGDGANYATARRAVTGSDNDALALAFRSVLARGGAELPEPLLGSVSAVVVFLHGRERDVLTALGVTVSPAGQLLGQVDDALQARTGIAAGTPLRLP